MSEAAGMVWPHTASSHIDNVVVAIDWIAGLFSAPPTPESVLALRSVEGEMALSAISELSGCPDAVGAMRSSLLGETPASVERTLASTYAHLFDGVGGPETVALCESAYTGVFPRLYGQASDDMRQLLDSMSLTTVSSFREPPDHLSVELGLLAHAIRLGQTADVQLLLKKLLRWVPCAAARLNEVDATGFYNGAAQILVVLLGLFDAAAGRTFEHDREVV
jgi:TorA-specific chaperone